MTLIILGAAMIILGIVVGLVNIGTMATSNRRTEGGIVWTHIGAMLLYLGGFVVGALGILQATGVI